MNLPAPNFVSADAAAWLHQALATDLRLDPARLGNDDNLLRLGMDSMQLMAWVNRLRTRGYRVRLRDLYHTPTLAGWLQLLVTANAETASAGPGHASPGALPCMTDGQPFALTPVQHAYLVGRDASQPSGGVGCHLYQEFIGGNGLEPETLAQAIRTLLGRHPMLHVRFLPEGLQRWQPEPAWQALTVHDLRDAGQADVARHLDAVRTRLGHRLLAVERGETFDCQLTLLPDGRHRLHVNLDLLVADAASFARIFTELAALAGGHTLPPLPDDYDFRSYLHQWQDTQASARERARDWWLTRLPDLPPAPALPMAADMAHTAPVRMSRRQFVVPPAIWQRFRTGAASCGVTPTMALATLFATILARWSATSRALLNLTLFDREPLHPAVDTMVADFTNILLLDLAGGSAPFDAMARANQSAFTEAWEHRQWSGVEVLRALRKGDRHPHGAPIVFTSNLGRPLFGHDPDKVLGEPDWGISQTPQVWLDHLAYEHGGRTVLQWDANDALFPPGLVDAMFDGYTTLVQSLANGPPSAWQSPLPDAMPARQRDIRRTVNQTAAPMPAGCLHDPVFARASATPDAVALIHGDDVVSYSQLVMLAKRLAGTLRAHGVHAGDHVAICMDKGIGQVVSALGILHAGAVYVPVAADQPMQRRQAICSDANARLVLTCASTGRPGEPDALALTWQAAVRGEPFEADAMRDASQPAYVIFTSGSTGTPKGVVITHAGALNTCADISRRYEVGPGDCMLGLSALHFDLSVYDIFGVLGAGGTLVLVDECQRRDPGAWCDAIARHHITLWNSVPALFDMLLTYAEGVGRADPARLRIVMVSGDWIGLDLPARYRSLRHDGLLVAMGGATEASIWSNVQEVDTLPPHWRSIPYGQPLANQKYRVVDEEGRDCPDWVAGELWIGGAGVASGYYNDARRTEAQFVEVAGERWYRTGDLGCYWPDGTLEFLGRHDRQVKLGGHRVELGEIDAALLTIPGVRSAITIALGERDKRLTACVVADAALAGRPMPCDPAMPAEPALLSKADEPPPYVPAPEASATSAACDAADDARVAMFLRVHLARSAQPRVAPRFAPLVARWTDWLRTAPDNPYPLCDAVAPPADHALTSALDGFHDTLDAILAGRVMPQALLDHPVLAPEALLLQRADVQAAITASATLVARLAHKLRRPVRLMEPHGRGGLLAAQLLRQLTPRQLAYTISDPSPDFVLRQRAQLSGYPHVQVLPASALDSAACRHQADVVLLNNVLHRQANPVDALQSAVRLAAPDAWVQVLELSRMPAIALITAALLEEEAAALPASAWHALFTNMALPCVQAAHHGSVASFVLRAPRNVHAPDAEALRERLRNMLPAYMVPQRLLWLDALPLTGNGKVDHQALADLVNHADASTNLVTQPPASERERVLAALWSQWLDLPAPHCGSHFFESGGDSLLATRLIGELARRGYRATLPDLFTAPTLAEFAATLVPAAPVAPVAPIGPASGDLALDACAPAADDRYLPVPLSDVQQAYLAGREPGFPLGGVGAHFFVEFDIIDLDVERLQQAWNTLIRRHDMLRAVVYDGQLRVMEQVPPLHLSRHIVTDPDSVDALALRTRLSRQILDATHWPVFDIQLAETPGHRHTRLYLTLDNLLLDGLSMQILLAELEQLYIDPSAILPPIDTNYRASRLAIDARPVADTSARYWRERIGALPGAPALPLLADPATIGPPCFTRLASRLAAADWQRLKSRAAPLRLTPSTVLLCAFGAVLSAWSTRAALTLNLTLFDRPAVHPHVERVLGDFTSLMLLAWTPDASWLATAQRLQEQLWQDLTHRDYGAIRVMRDIAREAGTPAAAMPVVFTSALGFDGGRFLHHGSWLRPNWGISQTPQVWLDHQVYESDGDLCFNWDIVEALFAPADLRAMFAQYEALLRRLASNENAALTAWQLPLDELVPRVVALAHPPTPDTPDTPLPAATVATQPSTGTGTRAALLRIRALFRDIVGNPIDDGTGFFDAGASSLHLVQLHTRLHDDGYPLAVTDLFAHPSPSALAAHLATLPATHVGPGSDGAAQK